MVENSQEQELERTCSLDHTLGRTVCRMHFANTDDESPWALGDLAKQGALLSAELRFSSINRPSEIILRPRLRHSRA